MNKEFDGIRVEEEGKTTFIPKHMAEEVPLKDREARFYGKAALVIAVLGVIGGGAADAVNFIRSCANENIIWSVIGYPPSTVADCVRETLDILPIYLQHLW